MVQPGGQQQPALLLAGGCRATAEENGAGDWAGAAAAEVTGPAGVGEYCTLQLAGGTWLETEQLVEWTDYNV